VNALPFLEPLIIQTKVRVIAFVGGITVSANNVESFNLSSNTWAAPASTGPSIWNNSMASSEINGHIYVMGGSYGHFVLNTNEVYVPAP